MLRVTVKQKGDFSKTTKWLDNIKRKKYLHILEKYGKEGVKALSAATPVDSGRTASAWRYEINQNGSESYTISYINDNVNKGVNIAIILQFGHGTGTGGWVEGRDYINPAIQPVFEAMADEVFKEVTRA